MDDFNRDTLFCDHYRTLDEEAILELNQSCNSCDLNNVVVGLEKHFYGLSIIDIINDVKYQLFYVRCDKKLEGEF